MAKELTYKIFVIVNGESIPLDSLSDEMKKEVSITLSDRAMRSIGYRPINDKTA